MAEIDNKELFQKPNNKSIKVLPALVFLWGSYFVVAIIYAITNYNGGCPSWWGVEDRCNFIQFFINQNFYFVLISILIIVVAAVWVGVRFVLKKYRKSDLG